VFSRSHIWHAEYRYFDKHLIVIRLYQSFGEVDLGVQLPYDERHDALGRIHTAHVMSQL
jgi:hypothetical protein